MPIYPQNLKNLTADALKQVHGYLESIINEYSKERDKRIHHPFFKVFYWAKETEKVDQALELFACEQDALLTCVKEFEEFENSVMPHLNQPQTPESEEALRQLWIRDHLRQNVCHRSDLQNHFNNITQYGYKNQKNQKSAVKNLHATMQKDLRDIPENISLIAAQEEKLASLSYADLQLHAQRKLDQFNVSPWVLIKRIAVFKLEHVGRARFSALCDEYIETCLSVALARIKTTDYDRSLQAVFDDKEEYAREYQIKLDTTIRKPTNERLAILTQKRDKSLQEKKEMIALKKQNKLLDCIDQFINQFLTRLLNTLNEHLDIAPKKSKSRCT